MRATANNCDEVKSSMRLAVPDLNQDGQIHQTGLGLINLFGSDLFSEINRELEKTDGIDWLTNYRKTNLVYQNYNFVDPSNLLKELLRVSTSPLRKPIRMAVPQKELVAFFNRIQVVLEDRNDWVHHNSIFTKEHLKSLILNLYPIAQRMNLELLQECDFFLPILDGVEPDIPQTEEPIIASTGTADESEWVKAIQAVIPENEPSVGELIEGKFLDFSYVLHLTGEIRNRKSNELLSDLNPEAANSIGTLLIARKPTGGRLRITAEGVLVAYFEDHWGYLAKVTNEKWFPNHLTYIF